MEVLPWSGVQHAGESDCPQQSSGTAYIYREEPNCSENSEQGRLEDGPVNDLSLKMEGPQIDDQGEGREAVCDLSTNSGCQCIGGSCSERQVEDQKDSCDFHGFEDDEINEPYLTSENSLPTVNTIEGKSLNNRMEGQLSVSEHTWLEGDESVALWVKWRGIWQAGIRCARADWPLSTLKAKPTHDRKKYFMIFFPQKRNYSWADMLLVRSINDYPEPIAYKRHQLGLEMVKDLTVARRFIMQKLVVGMLNIVDQFHSDALVETARDVMVWKKFAMEASQCTGYSGLGRMLIMLQNSIMQQYINANWLQHSVHSWADRCQNANSAELVELLMEELFDSLSWNDVNALGDAPLQPTLGSGWKTWKHEVMKWFFISPSLSSQKDIQQETYDDSLQASLQVRRKRPKLEVRRADTHVSQMDTKHSNHPITLETDPGFLNQDTSTTLAAETFRKEDIREVPMATDLPSNFANKRNDIVFQATDSEFLHNKAVESTPMNGMVGFQFADPGSKNQRCIAYIEAKGRQCVRWANDGDVYCCVHLSSRFVNSSARTERSVPTDAPMCEGTTVVGTRCKHRALSGSSFCKKHRSYIETNHTLNLPPSSLKRKHDESCTGSDSTFCKDMVLVDVESPMQVDPLSVIVGDALVRSKLNEKPVYLGNGRNPTESLHCIGSSPFDDKNPCLETPKCYFLYCEKHLPSWLKCARNGKSRIISEEVFAELMRNCFSYEQKVQLHKACELFYRLFKCILSLRNPVPKEVQFQWALTEASKEAGVGEFFTRLVQCEKERIKMIWGFNDDKDVSSLMEEPLALPSTVSDSFDNENIIKCKMCSAEFPDDQALGSHWMENHKKETQWLFRGYACAICLDSFTNKKVLQTHVQERHHVQFVEQCLLLQCIPCGSHFGNAEQLWLHVLAAHPVEFRPSKAPVQKILCSSEDSAVKNQQGNSASLENKSPNSSVLRKFICRFCGLKFDLLPDLGRHHQAAHMGPNLGGNHPSKRGIRYYAYRLKSGRLSRPGFKKGLAAASYRLRSRVSANLKRHIQDIKPLGKEEIPIEPHVTNITNIGKLAEHQCSDVAKILFSQIEKTKPQPNNLDILSTACSACCKVSLVASLEEKYGILPETLYLKAAKLCSEHNILLNWHQEGFICRKGCKPLKNQSLLSPLAPLPDGFARQKYVNLSYPASEEWEVDEFHCVIDSHYLKPGSLQKVVVLCNDISLGKESVPVICVVDQELLNSLCIYADGSDLQDVNLSKIWEDFTYVTQSMLDQSLSLDSECLQLGCACSFSTCCPETCDHVYLFDNDYDDARDIFGKSMHGRFPFDENGRMILEEGYLVYECNRMCRCNESCPNRVLQKGVRVKLEVFKTEKKGWGVRAGEAVMRGTFICEYIGEVLDEQEAHNRRSRYGKEGCGYLYDIDAHTNDMGRLVEGQAKFVVDATRYGNVSRFINHSCSPNLVSHQVLIESMDSQRAHIGLYASRDIALGEELTYDYHYEIVPGEGSTCFCGSMKCRGRIC